MKSLCHNYMCIYYRIFSRLRRRYPAAGITWAICLALETKANAQMTVLRKQTNPIGTTDSITSLERIL